MAEQHKRFVDALLGNEVNRGGERAASGGADWWLTVGAASADGRGDAYMRTTITLDDDTAALVQEPVRRQGATFKQAVNDAFARRSYRPHLAVEPSASVQ